jgi:hypothetical protein
VPPSQPDDFQISDLLSDPPVTPANACLCGHADAEHDAVAIRYCAATELGALPRSCMCGVRPTAAKAIYSRR